MPFQSQAQRAFMHIHHPRIADRWEDHTPKGKKLPQHVPGAEATEKKSAFYGHGVAQAMLDIGMIKMNEDQIPGGLADNKKPADFAADALAQGRKVEREHTSNESVAREIAMDHLTEDKNYYTKLEKMEKESIAKAAAFLKQAWPWSGGQGTLGPQAQASQRGAFLARPQGGSVPLDPSKGLGQGPTNNNNALGAGSNTANPLMGSAQQKAQTAATRDWSQPS